MLLECVRSVTRHTNLVVRPWLKATDLVGNISEKPEAVLPGHGPALDHVCELRDLVGDGGHGGGKDGVELAEVGEVAREVEWQGVEGVGVLSEDGE